MLRDEWNSWENFTENFEGILFVSAIYFVYLKYCMNSHLI